MLHKNLNTLLKNIQPKLMPGNYVFCTVKDIANFSIADLQLFFKEEESFTIIIKKELADELQLPYTFVAAWITLTVQSALDAVGFTAAFATALTKNNISCNVIAAYYHDHIFVAKNDAENAMQTLKNLSKNVI